MGARYLLENISLFFIIIQKLINLIILLIFRQLYYLKVILFNQYFHLLFYLDLLFFMLCLFHRLLISKYLFSDFYQNSVIFVSNNLCHFCFICINFKIKTKIIYLTNQNIIFDLKKIFIFITFVILGPFKFFLSLFQVFFIFVSNLTF